MGSDLRKEAFGREGQMEKVPEEKLTKLAGGSDEASSALGKSEIHGGLNFTC